MKRKAATSLAAVLMAAGGIAAAAPPAAAPSPGDAAAPLWARQCAKEPDGREQCFVEQYAVAMPAGTVLLNVRFSSTGPEGGARMVLTAPLGVLVPPGLSVSIDKGKPITLPFDRCDGGGCWSAVEIDRPALDQFRRGSGMIVRFSTGDRKTVDVPIALAGLDAALKQLAH